MVLRHVQHSGIDMCGAGAGRPPAPAAAPGVSAAQQPQIPALMNVSLCLQAESMQIMSDCSRASGFRKAFTYMSMINAATLLHDWCLGST